MSGHEQERLSAWLDGELGPAERAEVDAHLSKCETCATFLARLRAVDEAAREIPTSVPEGYFDRLPARVRARIEARRRVPGRLPVWAWAAAAVLLLAVVTPLTLRELRSPQPESPSGARPLAAARSAGSSSRPAAPPQPTVAPMPAAPAREPAPSALAERQPTRAFAPEPAENAPGENAVSEERAVRQEALDKRAATAEAKMRKGERAPESTEDEGVTASVEAGAPGAVAAADAAGATPPPTALQESVRDRLQAPAMVAIAPPVGSVDRAPSSPAARATTREDAAEIAFRRLADARPHTVEEWRSLRERWRAYVASFPDGAHADEARVRTIEAGLEAWKTGGGEEDAAVFQRDRADYLERTDALQKERVLELR